jgi:hypothetical protein
MMTLWRPGAAGLSGGFLTWQVAGGCMIRTACSFSEDAQWGTLEQVWLGACGNGC